jgi:hypothetical protein
MVQMTTADNNETSRDHETPTPFDRTPADETPTPIDEEAAVTGDAGHDDRAPGQYLDAVDADAPMAMEEPPRPRRMVQIPRGLFFALTGVAALLIIGLGTATGLLATADRSGNNAVVAKVNGQEIHRAEYDKAVAQQAGSQVLDNLVTERLIETEAKKRGITVDDQRTAQLLSDTKKQFGSDAEFQAALKQSGLTEQDLTKRLQLRDMLDQMVTDKIQVTDDEITNEYNQNKDQYQGKTLDQVHDQIKENLKQQKEQTAISDLLDQLKAAAKIETHIPGEQS